MTITGPDSITLILFKIVGGVALLLWGTRMVKLGFTRAYATSLRQVIAKNTQNRFTAFLSGLGVTAVLQSSTATALVLASFASKGMIGTAAGLAVMIGADVSTTLVAQVLTFDLSWLMPAFLICGVTLHHFYEHGGRNKHLARALIGLGLILLSLSTIKQTALPLGQSETLPMILGPLEKEPMLALIVAALLTWLLHSSLASVLIISSLAGSGIISLKLGMLLVLGSNLGGSIIPLAMTFNMGIAARRITSGNTIMRITTVLLMVPFVPLVSELLGDLPSTTSREVVHFHMFFNLVLAALFLPVVPYLAILCEKMNKESDKAPDPSTPQYLNDADLNSPTIALAAAARETLRMAEIVEEMFIDLMRALKKDNEKLLEQIHERDNVVDALHNEIKLYLTRVNEEALDPKESDRLLQILGFSTNLEHIGDIIDNSLIDIVKSKINKQHRFSEEGFREITAFHQAILNNMKLAQTIFISEDPKLARQLVEGKKTVREAEKKSTEQHIKRLRSRLADTMSTSALHTDIIRDFRRINSHITTVAYSIIDTAEQYKDKRRPETPEETPASA
ncbi:MAG: Na/Pi cotransporter family protein [Alphaproteobacteria bacterium]|nr:Na/Pi cotransporter family protein [Alphaproteobacteria bacterium]QQS57155.1 MAG: Na/Pi cotransporter family protein [Alphaproteobacteria bacterium]